MFRRTPNDKPLAALRAFAKRLGWSSLRKNQQTLPADAADSVPHTITWYDAGVANGGRFDCFLQINECPQGQTAKYTVGLYALRYRICTGWHPLHLADDMQAEVDRLSPWIHYRWLATPRDRKRFRELHPECVGYSWKRIGEIGVPYVITDVDNCVTARSSRR